MIPQITKEFSSLFKLIINGATVQTFVPITKNKIIADPFVRNFEIKINLVRNKYTFERSSVYVQLRYA